MKIEYWDRSDSGKVEQATKDINKESVKQTLVCIKRSYMPDWNYQTRNNVSLPNRYYPLHVAMDIAIKAIECQNDEFFDAIDKKVNDE